MVALASSSIVIIIMIIAVLCVKSKSYKYKRESVLLFLAIYINPILCYRYSNTSFDKLD